MKEKYTFDELKKIIETLRSKEGCPWDREQTHESLRQCMTEEAAELLAAIRIYGRTGDPENMKEELGDVLLQVLLHSQIASEEGIFDIEDVVTEVSRKMIRRHPHVFGSVNAEDTVTVLKNWEEIKKQEKEGKDWMPSQLRQIPEELPALIRAEKIWKKTDRIYERQPEPGILAENLADHAKYLCGLLDGNPEENRAAIEGETAEILSVLTAFCAKIKIQPEQILNDKIEEIIDKYENNI